MDDSAVMRFHDRLLSARKSLAAAADVIDDKEAKEMTLAVRDYISAGLFNEDEYSILGDQIETTGQRMVEQCRIGAERAKTP